MGLDSLVLTTKILYERSQGHPFKLNIDLVSVDNL